MLFSQVEEESVTLARALHHTLGLGPGQVVHLLLPNTTEFYIPVLATWLLHGVVSPSDPALSPSVLAQQLQEANTRMVFCARATLKGLREALNPLDRKIPVVVIDGEDDSVQKER